MITSKTSYTVSYNGFTTHPEVLDNAILNVFKAFDNDPEEIALFLNSSLKERKVNKLQNVLKETAAEMKTEDVLALKIDPEAEQFNSYSPELPEEELPF